MAKEKHRKIQYLAGICVSVAFTFIGATLSWSSPAIPKFKSGETNIQITDVQSSWVVSFLPLGALPGCYFGQVLSERMGRRKTIFISALPGSIGATIILFTKSPELMCLARFMIGMGTGMIAVVTMIYITEIADKEIRGGLGMLVQVMHNFGGLVIYGVGPFVSYTVLNSMVLVLPMCYALACFWIPESPYYYMKEERMVKARKVYMKLNGTKDENWADEELSVLKAHVSENMKNKTTLKELLTNLKYRKAIYIIGGLKILQYMTGSLAIQAYLEMIFRQSSSVSGPRASIIYGFVQLGAGIAATFLAGWFGRRSLMLVSCLGVALSLTIIGSYFFVQDSIKATAETMSTISALPLLGVLSFNILYTIGLGNLPYVMQAELFPINVKSVASSTATMVASVFSFAVTKCYQSIKDLFGHCTVFWFFAVIAYVGVIFIYFVVPETKDKTLEEVQDNMESKDMDAMALRNVMGTENVDKDIDKSDV